MTTPPLREAFERDWTSCQTLVGAFIASLVRDQHLVDDLLQEVALVAWRKYGEFDPKRSFTAWAIGIARLETLASQRTHARSIISFHAEVVERLSEEFAAGAQELGERERALAACLAGLGEPAARLVRLRYQLGNPPGEIARQLGVASNAVRVALHRIRATLADCIDKRLVRQDQDLRASP